MAGLSSFNGQLSPISAAQQFRAIAYLRWRLFANGFRRKGGKGELVARVIVYPIFALFVIGPALGAGFGSWAAVNSGKLEVIPGLFFGIFILQILVSINLSPPGLSFDPESLIRFPVTFPRYLTVRIFLGLLSASTIIGTVALLSSALGITVARPALGPVAFASAILVAVTNMFFVRMVFAWVDRWLSTRRARELFTGLIILFSIGMQYLNVAFNPGFNHHGGDAQRRKIAAALHLYNSSQLVLARFHPGLAGFAIINAAHGATLYALTDLLGVALFCALFLAVFAWRMQREYRGENLSDAPIGAATAVPTSHATPAHATVLTTPSVNSDFRPVSGSSPILAGLFYKEWIYIRRNTAQLYALLLPVAMVFIFAGRIGSYSRMSLWAFPTAIAYSTLTIAALAYNSLGLDAEGVQFYFLAPIHFRSVFLAKNLFGFGITALQAAIVYGVITYLSGPPASLIALATILWLAFAVLLNSTFGNMRSITAPKKMDPSKLSRRQASQLSALISVLSILLLAALGVGIMLLGQHLGLPWLPIPVFLVLATGALALYLTGLSRLDGLALNHRETMIEELTKAS